MTEASHQMTANPLPKDGQHIPGSVGLPQGSVRLTILDSKCQPVEHGKVGEVCALGPNITKGYIGRPEANDEAYAGAQALQATSTSCTHMNSWQAERSTIGLIILTCVFEDIAKLQVASTSSRGSRDTMLVFIEHFWAASLQESSASLVCIST